MKIIPSIVVAALAAMMLPSASKAEILPSCQTRSSGALYAPINPNAPCRSGDKAVKLERPVNNAADFKTSTGGLFTFPAVGSLVAATTGNPVFCRMWFALGSFDNNVLYISGERSEVYQPGEFLSPGRPDDTNGAAFIGPGSTVMVAKVPGTGSFPPQLGADRPGGAAFAVIGGPNDGLIITIDDILVDYDIRTPNECTGSARVTYGFR